MQYRLETGGDMEAGDGTWDFMARALVHPDHAVSSQDTRIGRGGLEGSFAVLDCGTTDEPDGRPVTCAGYVAIVIAVLLFTPLAVDSADAPGAGANADSD